MSWFGVVLVFNNVLSQVIDDGVFVFCIATQISYLLLVQSLDLLNILLVLLVELQLLQALLFDILLQVLDVLIGVLQLLFQRDVEVFVEVLGVVLFTFLLGFVLQDLLLLLLGHRDLVVQLGIQLLDLRVKLISVLLHGLVLLFEGRYLLGIVGSVLLHAFLHLTQPHMEVLVFLPHLVQLLRELPNFISLPLRELLLLP